MQKKSAIDLDFTVMVCGDDLGAGEGGGGRATAYI